MIKKVLFLGNDIGYFLSHRLPMARAAKSAGDEVHVAMPVSDEADKIRNAGLVFHGITLSRWGVHPIKELQSLISVYRLFRNLRPDLVHHVTIKPVLYGSLMARLTRVPAVVNAVSGLGFVFLAKGLKAKLVRLLVKIAYRSAFSHKHSRVIFQNPDDQAEFIQCKIVDSKKTILIRGSGVDMALFTQMPESDGPPVVILPSRMLWDKGVGEFVEAAGILRDAGVKARFVLVGGSEIGNPATVSATDLENWQKSGTVEWWGQCTDMPKIFAQSHIVCLPSYREGVPKALIEAAACGRPIVTTDVPGCREIVLHGHNGLLVPVRDAVSLAAALRTLIENADTRKLMGDNGRKFAAEMFSVEKVICETLAIYRELLT